jgi:hypothetical protein
VLFLVYYTCIEIIDREIIETRRRRALANIVNQRTTDEGPELFFKKIYIFLYLCLTYDFLNTMITTSQRQLIHLFSSYLHAVLRSLASFVSGSVYPFFFFPIFELLLVLLPFILLRTFENILIAIRFAK